MGFFKRTKKKDENIAVTEAVQEKATAKAQEEKVETEEEKAAKEQAAKEQEALMRQANPMLSTVANEGRRFTLLVEDAKQLEEEQGIQVAGNLYGNIQLGDLVYFILPNNMIMYSRIDGIEIGAGQNANKAENQRVVLLFEDIKDINCVPKYTVLTSIHPQDRAEESSAVENPHLLGLSRDYHRLVKDPNYFNVFIYVLCHAYFLVPVKTNGESEDAQIQFPALRDPVEETKSIFPVFTDWYAVAGWQQIFEDGKPPKAVILRFPDVVNICKGNGVMLNPFGPTAVMLQDKLIEEIVNLDGYKLEFDNK